MPILVQETCYSMPAHTNDPDYPMEYIMTDDDLSQRKAYFNNMLDETRLMCLVQLLDMALISQEPELAHSLACLKGMFFPRHFESEKIDRVFRKLAQNILLHGLQMPKPAAFIHGIHEQELIRWSNSHRLQANYANLLDEEECSIVGGRSYNECTDWGEARKLFATVENRDPMYAHGQHSVQCLYASQILGLPMGFLSNLAEKNELQKVLTLPTFSCLEDVSSINLLAYDIVILHGHSVQREAGTYAERHNNNEIELFPEFFKLHNQLKDIKIVPGETKVDDLQLSGPMCLLHELTHTGACLYTIDCEMRTVDLEDLAGCLDMSGRTIYKGYGMAPCIALATLDNIYGDDKAEANADNWAIYAQTLLMMLAYPEYDFLSSTKVIRRRSLLHCYSGFDALRHKDACSIQDLDGYDPTKDRWLTQTVDPLRRSLKDLLQVIDSLVEQHSKSLRTMLRDAGVRVNSDDGKAGKRPERRRRDNTCQAQSQAQSEKPSHERIQEETTDLLKAYLRDLFIIH